VRFRNRVNPFFGGCQLVHRTRDGRLDGAGDPRRGGAAIPT
jgi:gamma-glutamyltranspeptidase